MQGACPIRQVSPCSNEPLGASRTPATLAARPAWRSFVEHRQPVPSPDRAAQPQAAVARVVGLLRLVRVRRRARHRVQRDPRGGRAHRRQPAVQVPRHRPRCARARRPGDHPRRHEARRRAGLLHAVVRRARQGHRRRHRPPRRRGRVLLDRRRSAVPLADAQRARPRRGDRGRHASRSPPSRSRARSPGRARGGDRRSRSATCATSGARAGELAGASTSTSAAPATRATSATSCGSRPSARPRRGTRSWRPVRRTASAPRACSRSTSCASRRGSSCSRSTTRPRATR